MSESHDSRTWFAGKRRTRFGAVPDLRNRRAVLIALVAVAAALFAGGVIAGYLARHDRICPDGKAPIAQRSEVIGQTEYLCHGGKVVTK